MSYRLTVHARAELDSIGDYVFERNPRAARELMAHILATFDRLAAFPYSGFPVGRRGLRAAVIPRTSYVATYRLASDGAVEILTIVHGARRR